MRRDPFEVLGLSRVASRDEVRAARKRLARRWHPDRMAAEGQAAVAAAQSRLAEINEAADLALAAIARRDAAPRTSAPPTSTPAAPGARGGRQTGAPAEATRPKGTTFAVRAGFRKVFEDLVLAAAAFGEPQFVDAPRSLEIAMDVPVEGVARVTVAPSGDTTRVAVSMVDGLPQATGRAQVVRDQLIDQLNFLEHGSFGPR